MVLCIDTCTNVCSTAVIEDGKILAERLYNDKLKHSEILMVQVSEMISSLNKVPSDIKEIYVSNGPGSFTGIRIGVTTANTLAQSLGASIKSLSVLDLLAGNLIDTNGNICVMLDARASKYYMCIYNIYEGKISVLKEKELLHIDEIKSHIEECYEDIIIVGDVKDEDKKILGSSVRYSSKINNMPRAAVMPFIADSFKLQSEYSKPVYLEKSQAEKMLDKTSFKVNE